MHLLLAALLMISVGVTGELPEIKPEFDESINPEQYLVRPGDKLSITFIGAKIGSLSLKVDAEGRIVHETIGLIDLSGLSLTDARIKLEPTLRELYNAAQIVISISETRKVGIGVSGAVVKPGFYRAYTSDRVSDLLEMAGGIVEDGSTRRIVFSGGPEDIMVDLERAIALAEHNMNPPLYSGTHIYVPHRSSDVVQVVGAVHRPGEIELMAGDTKESLIQLAGGITDRADIAAISIVGTDNQPRQMVEAGSIILVPFLNGSSEQQLSIFGAVSRPGRFSYQDGMTLVELLDMSEGFESDANRERTTVFRTTGSDLWSGGKSALFPIAGLFRDGKPVAFLLHPGDSVFVPVNRGWVRVSGEVANPGYFPYESDRPASYYIDLAGGFLPHANTDRILKLNSLSRMTEPLGPGVTANDGDEIIVQMNEESR